MIMDHLTQHITHLTKDQYLSRKGTTKILEDPIGLAVAIYKASTHNGSCSLPLLWVGRNRSSKKINSLIQSLGFKSKVSCKDQSKIDHDNFIQIPRQYSSPWIFLIAPRDSRKWLSPPDYSLSVLQGDFLEHEKGAPLLTGDQQPPLGSHRYPRGYRALLRLNRNRGINEVRLINTVVGKSHNKYHFLYKSKHWTDKEDTYQ